MKTLVIGLGNPILGDDGVGWRVAGAVAEATAADPQVEVDCFSLGGLSLMERLTDTEHVILIDSLFTGKQEIGKVSCFSLDQMTDPSMGHTTAAHDTTLRNALKVGRGMGIHLPQDDAIIIVAIETQIVYDFSEDLTPAVARAVPLAVNKVLEILAEGNQG